jgi:EAL domain-containing protein (putative c-di-GMP-specific phosphodiesterase class I)
VRRRHQNKISYPSLQYIKHLPLTALKIDISFIKDIVINEHCRKIVKTIITMAQSLSLDVIAEGVETEEQFQVLLKLGGCTFYQGFLFGYTLPIEQFEELILNSEEQ